MDKMRIQYVFEMFKQQGELNGKGGIRLNDNVAVQVDGNEVLSKSLPRELNWLVVSE